MIALLGLAAIAQLSVTALVCTLCCAVTVAAELSDCFIYTGWKRHRKTLSGFNGRFVDKAFNFQTFVLFVRLNLTILQNGTTGIPKYS